MNRDDILRMAREAGFSDASQLELNVEWTCVAPEIEHFASLVAAAEREACALILENCVDLSGLRDHPKIQRIIAMTLVELAKGIRARGQDV
jgi:hypothetical protein